MPKPQLRLVILLSPVELLRAQRLAAKAGLAKPSTWAASVIRRLLAK